MPERNPTVNPLVNVGSVLESGTPNTGQMLWSLGGTKMACLYSGTQSGAATPATQLFLGAGRLDTAQYLGVGAAAPALASGQPVVFYDAHTPGTGYVSTSGHTVLAVLDPRLDGLTSTIIFNSGALLYAGRIQQVAAPFRSGLNVSSLSGGAGFAVSYTSVVSG